MEYSSIKWCGHVHHSDIYKFRHIWIKKNYFEASSLDQKNMTKNGLEFDQKILTTTNLKVETLQWRTLECEYDQNIAEFDQKLKWFMIIVIHLTSLLFFLGD